MRSRPLLLPVLFVLITLPVLGFQHESEAKAEVPALSDFHQVIYVIWHEAWPAKDHAKLRSLLPDIEKAAASLSLATLPGILHHKQSAWNEGVQALESTVEEYRAAVKADNNEALMSAAEKLHSNFEQLVRVIRPPMKELEDFHSTLYMLYHHYLPAYDLDKIKSASTEMTQKMAVLRAAELPNRLSGRKEAFDKARQELGVAVAALEATVQSGDKAKVKQAVEEVHSRYEEAQNSLTRSFSQESQAPPKPRYDEANVVSYPLPDLLALPNGKTVKGAEEWRTLQRGRIFELLETQVYGRRIGSPDRVRFRLTGTDPRAMDGKATLKQVTVTVVKGTRELEMPLVIFLPNDARKPVPLFLLINHRAPENTDPTRKVKSDFWPAEQVVARGYGIAAFQASDIDPDKHDGFKNGIHGLLETGERPDDAWGTIAAWGWGASWAVDYFETDSDIDAHRVAVVGHSRGGKTALWAAARDERFAIACSNCSGCAGAALSKRMFGETIEAINRGFPHWFCKNFTRHNNKEAEVPFDQHMLLALIAPRGLYVVSAEEDVWADPKGEYLSLFHAGPVYRLFGLPAVQEQMPALDSPAIAGRVGYHIRTGKHNLTLYDWMRYLDFADTLYKQWPGTGRGR